MLNRLQVSVPLSGLLFLNEYLKQQDIEQFKSFRPLIGVIISKRWYTWGRTGIWKRFRPLIGVIISKPYLSHLSYK